MVTLILFIGLISQSLLVVAVSTQNKGTANKPQPKPTKSSGATAAKTEQKTAQPGERSKKVDETTVELRQRSINIILLAAEGSTTLDDECSAIRIQSFAADVLWKQEQVRARQLFQSAFAAAITHHHDGKGTEQEQLGNGLSLSKPDLRLEVIRLVSKHDAQLSRQFSDQYVEEKKREQEEKRNQNKPSRNYDPAFGAVDEISHDTLHIAEKLLDANRKEAFGLAESAFAKGVPQAAGYLFAEIAERDRAAADQLYLMALNRLQRDKNPVPGQLLLLASYPFGDGNVWVSSGESVNSYSFPVADKFAIDEKIVRRFIATAFIVLARNLEGNVSQLPDANARIGAALFAAKLLQPRIARYNPERSEEWHSLTNALFYVAGEQTRLGIDKTLNQIHKSAKPQTPMSLDERIKALLDRAQNTNVFAKRDELYQKAVLLANQKPDTAYALEIADKINNREFRKKLRSWLNFEAATRAIGVGKLDEARLYAVEVEATDQSAYLFLQIARIALANKDQVKAQSLLVEAEQKALAAENTPEKLRALVGLIGLYARFDSLHGFDLANEAVRTANKTQNYDTDRARLIRNLETPSGKSLSVSVENTEEFDLGKTLASLAKADFEQALLLAQSLEDKRLGLMAVISVAASVFDKKPAEQTP